VLTITKALNKTTNCTFRAKKSGGARPKKFLRRVSPDRCPHFQIRSDATADTRDFYDTGATCLL